MQTPLGTSEQPVCSRNAYGMCTPTRSSGDGKQNDRCLRLVRGQGERLPLMGEIGGSSCQLEVLRQEIGHLARPVARDALRGIDAGLAGGQAPPPRHGGSPYRADGCSYRLHRFEPPARSNTHTHCDHADLLAKLPSDALIRVRLRGPQSLRSGPFGLAGMPRRVPTREQIRVGADGHRETGAELDTFRPRQHGSTSGRLHAFPQCPRRLRSGTRQPHACMAAVDPEFLQAQATLPALSPCG